MSPTVSIVQAGKTKRDSAIGTGRTEEKMKANQVWALRISVLSVMSEARFSAKNKEAGGVLEAQRTWRLLVIDNEASRQEN